MSIQKTTHYNLDLPSKGTKNWNENLNGNFSKVDTILKQQHDRDNSIEANIQLIWKTPVANFSAIPSTYPSPSISWAVQTLDDGKIYRYDGSNWNYIATGNITPNKYYVWIEEKTINKGNNSFVLANTVGVGHKLIIKDLKYGVEWFEGLHWNRNSQTIILTESSLDEDLTFVIYNLG